MSGSANLVSHDGHEYRVIAPLAYQGKVGCKGVRCTRMFVKDPLTGKVNMDLSKCIGWHCSYCDEACSSQGHMCEVAKTMIEAVEKIAEEEE